MLPTLPARCAALLALLLPACNDIPTALPRWNTRWVVPVDETRIGVASLLPAGVTVTPDGSAFALALQPAVVSRSLGQLCGAPCTAAQGRTVPKPAFEQAAAVAIALPADLAAVRLSAGAVRVRLTHTFAFDPLRPSPTARGYLVLEALSGGAVLARDSVSGTGTPWAPGTALERVVPLAAGPATHPITVRITLRSPAGSAVRVDTAQGLTLSATPQGVRVSEAEVRVAGRPVAAQEVRLELEGFDEAVREQVRGGALRLTVDNPFAVSGALEVTVRAPGTTVRRSVQVEPGVQERRVELTGAELQSLLGQPSVTLGVAGTVSAASGSTAVVTPADFVRLASRLELVVGAEDAEDAP